MTRIARRADNSFGRHHYSPPSETDLRAWRRTINHLDKLGLTALGVPLDVMLELYATGDDNLRRIVANMWDAA